MEANNEEVICPNCTHQFRAIPVQVQQLMLAAGFEPPFLAAPAQAGGQEANLVQTPADTTNYMAMFEDACFDLAAIHTALGIPDDEAGGAEPILNAIEELKAGASPAALTVPDGYAIKRVDGHGWIIDPPSGSRWIAHEGTPAGDFIAALLAAQPAEPARVDRQDDGALIDAANARAAIYDDDDRPCIKTDVMNAFYAGAAWQAKADRQGVALSDALPQSHGGNLDEATAKAILAFVNRPGDTYNGYVRRQLGLGFALALKRAIDRASSSRAEVPPNVLSAIHRAGPNGGYANLAALHPVSVEDQLPEHQLTEFESYGFSDGVSRIMTRPEFDKEYGRDLRAQLEQAREVRRLNRSRCDDTFGSSSRAEVEQDVPEGK